MNFSGTGLDPGRCVENPTDQFRLLFQTAIEQTAL